MRPRILHSGHVRVDDSGPCVVLHLDSEVLPLDEAASSRVHEALRRVEQIRRALAMPALAADAEARR